MIFKPRRQLSPASLSPGARPTRRSLVRLDRCDQVHPGQALLIARADRYLPVPLAVDGDAVPATGETIVRVLMPARRSAAAADAPAPLAGAGES